MICAPVAGRHGAVAVETRAGEVAAARRAERLEDRVAVLERAEPCRPVRWCDRPAARAPRAGCPRAARSRPAMTPARRARPAGPPPRATNAPSRSAVSCATGTSFRMTTDARCRSSAVSDVDRLGRRCRTAAPRRAPARATGTGSRRACAPGRSAMMMRSGALGETTKLKALSSGERVGGNPHRPARVARRRRERREGHRRRAVAGSTVDVLGLDRRGRRPRA